MALVGLLENARWSCQTACLAPKAPRRQQVQLGFSNHPIVRNPAENWIIEKKAAPMIHIHLESRISRWYEKINRNKNQAEAEIQPVSGYWKS
jgi:hypothetical protein